MVGGSNECQGKRVLGQGVAFSCHRDDSRRAFSIAASATGAISA
jgi:hypothetical protein